MNGVKKSKGYGFITYENKESADEAIKAMHDSVSNHFIFIILKRESSNA